MSLDERYGRRPAGHRRPLLLAALGVFAVAAVAWMVWSVVGTSSSRVTWENVGVDASDPAAVRVTFEVYQAAGNGALCSVRATDAEGETVGWTDVPVRPSTTGTAVAEVRLRTIRPATGGGVVSCVRR
jgi:hypothetical protein